MKIWLDDERPAPSGWMWVKDPRQANCLIKTQGSEIEAIAFDHDLGTAMTGYDVACQLEEEAAMGRINKDIHLSVHSANPVGKQRIKLVCQRILSYLRDIR